MSFAILACCPLLLAPLEILNETRCVATYYPPAYLLMFPGFHFPVSILFGGAAYVAVLHLAADVVARRSASPRRRAAWYWLSVLVLSTSSVGAEALGVTLKLWYWYRPRPFTIDFALGAWKYYACFIFGSIALAKIGTAWVDKLGDSGEAK